jgi:putative ribosome biogenesis GTPase RsgA
MCIMNSKTGVLNAFLGSSGLGKVSSMNKLLSSIVTKIKERISLSV